MRMDGRADSSPTALRITGYIPEDTGFNAFGYLHPDDLPRALELFTQIRQESNSIITTELRIRHKSGQWIWIEFTVRNLLAEPGINAILVNFRDSTSRKELEEKLRQSEQRFRALTENISDGIMLYDAEGKIIYLSPTVTRLTGYGQEIIGQHAFMFGHPEDIPHATETLMQLMEHPEKSVTSEFHLQHKNGSYIWIESTLRNMLTEPGMNAILVNFKDITARKQSETKFRQLSQAVEQSPISIVITDTAGNIEYVNPRFTQLTGYTFEDVVGRNPRLLKSDQTSIETYTELWTTIKAGREWRGEFINRKKNGEIFIEQASISSVLNSNRVATHFLAIKEDVTERKQLENALIQNEKRFRAMIENSADAIALVDADGIITYMTSAITNISGHPTENYIGHTALEFVHPDDLPKLVDGFTRLLESPGGLTTSLFRSQHMDGSWRWLDITASNQLAEPAVQSIIINFRDVTERRRAEELLKQAEERLRLIVETIPVPILISTQNDGTILFTNAPLGEMVGLPAEELLGRYTPDFYFDPITTAGHARHTEKRRQHTRLRTGPQKGGWHSILGFNFFAAIDLFRPASHVVGAARHNPAQASRNCAG